MSPTMDETEFFRELLQDERIDEEAVIADEPDEYLLCTNVTQQVGPDLWRLVGRGVGSQARS